MPEKKTRARIVITGSVQGVFFRAYARERARMLRLLGWVRNCPDGSVEVVVEGNESNIEEFIQWCHKGPSTARVNKVSTEWGESCGEFNEFSVRF